MALIAFDAVTNSGYRVTSFAHPCAGSDRLLVVFIANDAGNTLNGVTYGGQALTQIPSLTAVNGSTNRILTAWALINPPTGSNTVALAGTFPNALTSIAVSYTGCRQTGIPDASHGTGPGTATTSRTETVTTTADKCWTILVTESNGTNAAAGAGSVIRSASGSFAFELFDSNAAKTPAGATSMTATNGSAVAWASLMISIAPNPGAQLASSAAFGVSATVGLSLPRVTASRADVGPGGPITANFTEGPGYARDWIALYPVGAPDANFIDWFYVNGTKVAGPEPGAKAGAILFTAPPLPSRTYEFRWQTQDTYTLIARSGTFTVADLSASAALQIAASATFAGVVFSAPAVIRISTAASLTATARFAAASTIAFSASALFGAARFAATASVQVRATATLSTGTEDLHAATATILLAGVSARTRIANLTIRDVLNDAPNSCTLTIDSAEDPTAEQTLRVLLNLDAPRLLFNGALQTVDLSYEGWPPQRVFPCSAIDDTARANRMRPFGTWTNVSATTFAQDLMTRFAPGFTTAHVQAGLPPVTITLDGTEGMSGALKQAATQIGGYFYFEDGDLHLFIEEVSDTPDPIDGTPGRLLEDPPIRVTRDDSQLRTRQCGRAHGEQLLSDIAAGEAVLPVANAAAWFNTTGSGRRAIVLGQRLVYSGTQAGGGGSLVGPGAAPSTAPALALVAGTGLGPGLVKYAYTSVTPTGESAVSPLGAITPGVVTSTVAPPTAAVTPLMSGGTEQIWACYTYLTAAGETIAGTLTRILDWNAAPGALLQNIPTGPAGVTARRLYRTKDGGDSSALFLVTTWPDNTTTSAILPAVSDAALGAAVPTTNTATVTATMQQVAVSGIAVGPAPTTARKLYRTAAGGSQLKLVTTIGDNVTTTFADATPDASLGANAPVSDTSGITQPQGQVLAGSTSLLLASAAPFQSAGGWAVLGSQLVRYTGITGNTLTGIPATGVGALLTTVRYGQEALPAAALVGVTTLAPMHAPPGFPFLGLIAGAGVDDGLHNYGCTYQSASGETQMSLLATITTGGGNNQVVVPPVVLSPGALFRNIYRTKAGGGPLYYLGTNATGFTDVTPDSSLHTLAPTADTAGLLQPITVPIPRGTPINIWVQRDDLDAQAEQAAVDTANGIVPADGIYEGPPLVDERRNEATMAALCDATLVLYARPIVTVRYDCRDPKTKSGKLAVIDLDEPPIHETLTIQEVTITEIGIALGLLPRFAVVASTVRQSLDDILRRLLAATDSVTSA